MGLKLTRPNVATVIAVVAAIGVPLAFFVLVETLPDRTVYRSLDQAARFPRGAVNLHLENQALSDVPDRVRLLTKLRYLDLTGNRIQNLPDWLTNQSTIDYIRLDSNGLSSIPHVLLKMPSLRELDLRSNSISKLPPDIGSLARLERLDLGQNELVALPSELGQLGSLVTLILDGNKLSRLPPEIGKLSRLETLVLYNNRLRDIPDEVSAMTRLRYLSLSGNPLSDQVKARLQRLLPDTRIDYAGPPKYLRGRARKRVRTIYPLTRSVEHEKSMISSKLPPGVETGTGLVFRRGDGKTDIESAGQNRHGADERPAWKRISEPFQP